MCAMDVMCLGESGYDVCVRLYVWDGMDSIYGNETGGMCGCVNIVLVCEHKVGSIRCK